jgi:hypothetical protein
LIAAPHTRIEPCFRREGADGEGDPADFCARQRARWLENQRVLQTSFSRRALDFRLKVFARSLSMVVVAGILMFQFGAN